MATERQKEYELGKQQPRSSSPPRETSWRQVTLGLLLVIGVIIGAAYIFKWTALVSSGLQKEVAAAIVAAVGTILVSVLTVTIGKYYERKRSIEQELREKKIPMYNDFIKFLLQIFMIERTGKKMSEKDMVTYFSKFTQELMVWGSDEVVKLWSSYRRQFAKGYQADSARLTALSLIEKRLV